MVESRPSSGLFAIVRRNNSVEDSRTPLIFREHRRGHVPDCDFAEYNGETEESECDHYHDAVIQSDDRNFQDSSEPEYTGRFAMEYEVERKMMRSAENSYIQRSMYGDNANDTINLNAHRIINPASVSRSEPNESEAQQRRHAFGCENDDSIFV